MTTHIASAAEAGHPRTQSLRPAEAGRYGTTGTQSEVGNDGMTGTQSAERLWDAVLARDARSDGHFVYAVRSTGIYCRPSCPSRRPNRDSVRFFSGPDAAEVAGFRECRRCHPRAGVAPAPGLDSVRKAAAYIASHADRLPVEFVLTGIKPTPWTAETVALREPSFGNAGLAANARS